jgi:hypothetical protein
MGSATNTLPEDETASLARLYATNMKGSRFDSKNATVSRSELV